MCEHRFCKNDALPDDDWCAEHQPRAAKTDEERRALEALLDKHVECIIIRRVNDSLSVQAAIKTTRDDLLDAILARFELRKPSPCQGASMVKEPAPGKRLVWCERHGVEPFDCECEFKKKELTTHYGELRVEG